MPSEIDRSIAAEEGGQLNNTTKSDPPDGRPPHFLVSAPGSLNSSACPDTRGAGFAWLSALGERVGPSMLARSCIEAAVPILKNIVATPTVEKNFNDAAAAPRHPAPAPFSMAGCMV